ncbi:MAG: hypothetical protein U0R71_14300 [Solirubrobacterales bacterium]
MDVRLAAILASLACLLAPAGASANSALLYVGTGKVAVEANHEVTVRPTCPGGYSALGSGYRPVGRSAGNIGFYRSGPAGPGAVAVTGQNVDDLREWEFEAFGSCAPTEALQGLQLTSQEVTLDPAFKAGGRHEATAFAACPAGSLPVGGGFDVPDDGINVAVTATAPAPEAGGWTVRARNFAKYESRSFEAEAVCVSAQTARGLLMVHYVREEDEFEEGTLQAPCSFGGRPLSGGASASGSSGSMDALSFYPQGYEVTYNSGKEGNNLVQAMVVCGDVTEPLGGLTAESFQRFCEDEFEGEEDVRAVHGETALSWKCLTKKRTFEIAGSVGEVCRDAYYRFHSVLPKAIYLNLGDPFSWRCFAPEAQVRQARPTARRAGGFGAGPPGGEVEVRGSVLLPRKISLARTRIGLRSVLAETSARGELLRRRGGRDVGPVILRRLNGAGGGSRRGVYATGRSPRLRITLDRRAGRRLSFTVRATGGSLAPSYLCRAASRVTLTTRFTILRGDRRLADIATPSRWSCSRLAH